LVAGELAGEARQRAQRRAALADAVAELRGARPDEVRDAVAGPAERRPRLRVEDLEQLVELDRRGRVLRADDPVVWDRGRGLRSRDHLDVAGAVADRRAVAQDHAGAAMKRVVLLVLDP